MVRISFRPTPSEKRDKDEEHDVVINQLQEQEPLTWTKKYFPVRLCAIIISVLVILLGLVLGSFYLYRHFYPAESVQLNNKSPGGKSSVKSTKTGIHSIDKGDVFKCHVVYSDYGHIVELNMEVAISLQHNYQYIKLVTMNTESDSPIDIIHDFENSKTAYYHKKMEKCFVAALNTKVVKAPRNLWELLTNTKREIYLPDNYKSDESMRVTGPLIQEELGPAIQQMCKGKKTFQLEQIDTSDEISAGPVASAPGGCEKIIHFENRYMVNTRICNIG